MKFKGKVVIVTGAGSGIGQAIAIKFANEGARVVIAEINQTNANNTRDAIKAKNAEVLVVPTDVSSSPSVAHLFQTVDSHGWNVDILVNNAGNAGALAPVHEITDEQWIGRIAVHLNGTFYCTRESIKRMIPRKRGVVINIGSVAGLTGLVDAAHYTAAKGGIMAFTKGVAQEVAPYGIRVNCIAPGWINTPLLSDLTEEVRGIFTKMTPLGRFGTAEEVAEVAVFLASAESSFIVGQIISPNGGFYT